MQRVERSIRVSAPAAQVYERWRGFESFPRFMENVEEVRLDDPLGNQSRWRIKGPLGSSVEFEARVILDEPNRSIGWRSTGGSIETSGTVTFSPVDQAQTEVHVILQWNDPPGGALGEAAARVLQSPEAMLDEDLRRFKGLVEGRATAGDPLPGPAR
jgi:uncharacterized membrane protein